MTERLLLATIALIASLLPAMLQAQSCESLSKLSSPTISIAIAESIGAGTFAPREGGKKLSGLPAFCRVAATLRPTSDSDIQIEVWLPLSGWNGKYLAIGSGGWGGSIAYGGMAEALRRGYATSATNDGHTGSSASFVVGHPREVCRLFLSRRA